MARTKKQKPETPEGGDRQGAAEAALHYISVSALAPSPLNPRKTLCEESLHELAASVARYGILSPLTVRQTRLADLVANPEAVPTYEIICGHRRWMAAKEAGLETVPAIVREMTDDEAVDLMITENLQREDISPLEEAEAYSLLVQRGDTVQDLCARFGKSDKYVRGRLRLDELTDGLKDLLRAGKVSLSAALELSKLSLSQQDEFVGSHVLDEGPDLSVVPLSLADVREYLEEMELDLEDTPFYEEDEEWGIRPKCRGCLFNSSSQGALFPELAEPGTCQNADCYYEKKAAYARLVLRHWTPNLLPKDGAVTGGCVVLGVPSYSPNFRDKKDEELYEDLRGSFAGYRQHSNYDSRYTPVEGAPLPPYVYTKIDLHDLVLGREYITYHHAPAPRVQDLGEVLDRWELDRRLAALRDKRQNKLTSELLPLFDAALEAYNNTPAERHPYIPPVFEAMVATALFDFMPYYEMCSQIPGLTHGKVCDWLKEHTLPELLTLTLDSKVKNDSNRLYQGQLLEHVMGILSPDATREATEKVFAKYQDRYNRLVAQLAELGYDENNKPLHPDADGQDDADPDGRELPDDSVRSDV